MIRFRHAFLTFGWFAVIVGLLMVVLAGLGLFFAIEGAPVILLVCPPAFLVPGVLLVLLSARLSRQYGMMKGLAGMLRGRDAVTAAEIAERFSIPESEAGRLAHAAVLEGYVDGVYDVASHTLRPRATGPGKP